MLRPVSGTSELGHLFGVQGLVGAAVGVYTEFGKADYGGAFFSQPVARGPLAPFVNRHLVRVVSFSHDVL